MLDLFHNRPTQVAYDAAGRPAGLILPSGRIVDYRYAGGRITGIDVDSQPLITDARHAPFGPIEGWTWGNGQASRIVHDLDGRPTRIEGLVTLLATDFVWDVADRVTAVQDGLRLPDSFGYDNSDLYRDLIAAGIGLEHMDTGAAYRTYNILAAEGRAVAAALIIEP